MRRAVGCWALCLLAASGCSFEGTAAQEAVPETNACFGDDDCGPAATCQDGMCVAQDADAPLAVMLEVSPLRMPDGSDSLPIVLPRFRVDGPLERVWELPLPVTIGGRIEHDGEPLDAELRFVPVEGIPRVQRKAVTASTGDLPQGAPDDVHYSVRLLSGLDYRLVVDPVNDELPPFQRVFTAREGGRVNLDYGDLSMRQQTFAFSEAPPDRTLTVRAFDPVSGERISSIATIEDGRATLLFSPGATAFYLEIRAEQAFEAPLAGDGDASPPAEPSGCDTDTPSFPVLRISDEDIEGGQVGIDALVLPPAPTRIRYEGTVELCPGATLDVTELGSLPISLRSTRLFFEQGDEPTLFGGFFSATTDAELDADSRQLRFCVEVMPGDYELVVTPPAGLECAIFAESRSIAAPDGRALTGALMELPAPAYLTGRLRTGEGEPMAGALVDAVALGRRDGIELAEDDASIAGYNRSNQTESDDDGAFRVPVDLGSYDVMVKPLAGSGFAWTVLHDVDIGARDREFATLIDVAFPLPIDGQLRYADGLERDDATLEGAEVRAFAVLEDNGSERAVPIAKAVAGAEGRFTMLVAPMLREGW